MIPNGLLENYDDLQVKTSRYTWSASDVNSLSGTANSFIIATIPVGTVVTKVVLIVKTKGQGVATLTVSMGKTSSTYDDYIVASDATVNATLYGQVVEDLGTAMATFLGDLPSLSDPTDLRLRFDADEENLSLVVGCTGEVFVYTIALFTPSDIPYPLLQYAVRELVGFSHNEQVDDFPNTGTLSSADLTVQIGTGGPAYVTHPDYLAPGGLPTLIFGANGVPLDFGRLSALRTASALPSVVQPFTIFAVVNMFGDDTKYKNIIDCHAGIAGATLYVNPNATAYNGKVSIYAGTDLGGVPPFPEFTWYLIDAKFDGGSSNIYRNGVLHVSGNAGTSAFQGVTLGSSQYNPGDGADNGW